MRTLKKQIPQCAKLLCLSLILTTLFTIDCNAQTTNYKPKEVGTVVLVETILRVKTNPSKSTDDIKQLQVFALSNKVKVLDLPGCELPNCDFDLSALPSGFYKTLVFTTNGQSFSKKVFLK